MRVENNPYANPEFLNQKMLEWANRWTDQPLQGAGIPDELPSGLSDENLRSLMRGNFRNRLQKGKDQLFQEMQAPRVVAPEAEDLAANGFQPTRPDLGIRN